MALFCDSRDQPFRVQVVRQGSQEAVVFDSARLAPSNQPVPGDAAAHGCDWQACLDIPVAADWPSGFYLVRMIGEAGAGITTAEAFFVVRPSSPPEALLVLSTSTWSAYNDSGGPSFYTGGHTSSMMRPLPRGFLAKADPHRFRVALWQDLSRDELRAYFSTTSHSAWSLAAGWANWEHLFVRWAEAQGVNLGFATSQDLDSNPNLLDGCSAYVSVGHDEYWSAGMRDNVEQFVDAGGNAAFFSGNTAFWQIRFGANHSRVICYKNGFRNDPVYLANPQATRIPELATMWSDPLIGRPENTLTGVSFTRGGYAHMPNAPQGSGGYTVWRPDHWAFDDVDLLAGDLLGADPVVVGYECDGCELTLHHGLPVATGTDGTPVDFDVLATAPTHLWETHEAQGGMDDSYIGELNWVAERLGGADTPANRTRFGTGRAVLGWFRRGSGEVFTTGCTDWAYGLDDPDVRTVTRNVLDRFTRST